jgi:hypothetical protein
VRIRVLHSEATRDRLVALRRVLEAHRGDCGVVLHLVIPGESETVVGLPGLFGRPVADRQL